MKSKQTARAYLSDCFIIPHDGDMVSWADGKLKIPYSVRYPIYIANESPWLIEVMRAISDPKIKRVDVRMPAGAAKSLIGEIMVAQAIVESHGLFYYVWQTDDDAKDAMEDRIIPMIEANDFLSSRLPEKQDKIRRQKIAFPGFSFYCIAAKPSKAQSKRVKILVMEEPHCYEAGMMSAFEKRIEGVKDPKIVTLSTGSIIGDESDESFLAGSCEEYQVPCPHCGTYQAMNDSRERLLAQLDDEVKDENGEYTWSKIIPTVRYNCVKCNEDWSTDPEFRKEQSQSWKYVATNPNAPADHRSFHMEAVSVHYFPLSQLLMEKIKAVQSYKRGAIEPFKDYMQKRRAMAWDESPTDGDDEASFERSKGDYLKGEPYEHEISRFMCVDNQAGKASKGEYAHRWFVCRSFGEYECRLIDEGKITTWEEVEEKRKELGVEPGRVLVDCAFDTPNVQAICVKYGWQGLWGDPSKKNSFPHHVQVNTPAGLAQITRQLPFSKVQVGHVGLGTGGQQRQARYFFWCHRPIKDMWHRLKGGHTTYKWSVPADISSEYKAQTNVEFKRQVTVKSTGKKVWEWFFPPSKANHLTDCDQMCLVAAIMDAKLQPILWTVGSDESAETTKEIPVSDDE